MDGWNRMFSSRTRTIERVAVDRNHRLGVFIHLSNPSSTLHIFPIRYVPTPHMLHVQQRLNILFTGVGGYCLVCHTS